MGEILGFLLIVSAMGWGTAFLIPLARKHYRDLDKGVATEEGEA